MGKNLRQQRRGKGPPGYRSPGFRYLGKVRYPIVPQQEGKVLDIIHAPGRRNPVALVEYADKKTEYMIPAQGVASGETLHFGTLQNGSVTDIGKIPEGTKIFNIEIVPGDGGRLCRTSGVSAMVISHDGNKTVVLLPSKKTKELLSACKATVGIASAGGRTDKPFRTAGHKFHLMHALGKHYPHVRGVAQNAVNHPFGGKTRPGKHKSVSRSAPPGRKVGNIAARRTGKKKRS
ncbi:MAG: 50S ribosomal protein L2 [Candidatus Aenigmarchaeota archaeon]|nr:50S ribosomal protein L2 [Candidatus Aenigmarchaeota archaeon]